MHAYLYTCICLYISNVKQHMGKIELNVFFHCISKQNFKREKEKHKITRKKYINT